MRNGSNLWALALLACLSLSSVTLAEQVVHKKTYLSEVFELASGDVLENYKNMEMPEGHIALRDFFAEVVDENGNSVPLSEVYLHHWVASSIYMKKGRKELLSSKPKMITDPTVEFNLYQGHEHRIQFQEGADVNEETRRGTCADKAERVGWGIGSETRHSDLSLPAPYGLETGNLAKVPEGHEESWILNIHAIDTRGAVDAISCVECLCEAYGVTRDDRGRPLPEGYRGGLLCCYDGNHCAVKEGSAMPSRKLFLKYTVTWVDMDETVIPVRQYLLDATDSRTSLTEQPRCGVEYDITGCNKDAGMNTCIDQHRSIAALARGGEFVKGTLHQHGGGMGGIVYKKDGLVLCKSDPIYGKGTEAGDEAGYLVGITACNPEPGSMFVEDWELLHFDAYYSKEHAHTGVMSTFSLTVADPVIREAALEPVMQLEEAVTPMIGLLASTSFAAPMFQHTLIDILRLSTLPAV